MIVSVDSLCLENIGSENRSKHPFAVIILVCSSHFHYLLQCQKFSFLINCVCSTVSLWRNTAWSYNPVSEGHIKIFGKNESEEQAWTFLSRSICFYNWFSYPDWQSQRGGTVSEVFSVLYSCCVVVCWNMGLSPNYGCPYMSHPFHGWRRSLLLFWVKFSHFST